MFNCAHNHCEHNYNRRSFFSKHFSIKRNEADRFEGSPYSHGTDPVENPRQLVLDELVWRTEINKASTIRLIVLGLLNARSQFPIRAVSEKHFMPWLTWRYRPEVQCALQDAQSLTPVEHLISQWPNQARWQLPRSDSIHQSMSK